MSAYSGVNQSAACPTQCCKNTGGAGAKALPAAVLETCGVQAAEPNARGNVLTLKKLEVVAVAREPLYRCYGKHVAGPTSCRMVISESPVYRHATIFHVPKGGYTIGA